MKLANYLLNKTKITLCDNSTGEEFGFRHILRCFLLENGVDVLEVETIDLNIQKAYWKQDPYKARGHFDLKDEYVGQILKNSEWIFAKTMAKTNPHWYTLRKNLVNN